jgi:cell division protein FtsQ
MDKGKIVSLEDRIPKLKQQRRKKANKRLITLLFLFFLLIGCILYVQSPLSRVKSISVTGNGLYPSEQIISLSGLTHKTNIWKVNENSISEKLLTLPEMKSIKIKIQLPNSVIIQVKEFKRIAYLVKEGDFLAVLENGKIIENSNKGQIPVSAPILIGFTNGDVLDEMITSLEQLPDEIVNSISEIHHTPKETDKYKITLFMNDGFEVRATLRTFSDKMVHYPSIISQLDPNKKGIIDLEVGSFFKAYESEGAEPSENEGEGEG